MKKKSKKKSSSSASEPSKNSEKEKKKLKKTVKKSNSSGSEPLRTEELTWEKIGQIIEKEGIEQALRLDAYSLMLSSINNSKCNKEKQNQELFDIFKQYMRTHDSSILLTRILAHTEDMTQFFILENFSNND